MLVKRIAIFVAAGFAMHCAAAQELLLAVNEGVTYQDGGPINERYKPLLDLLSKALRRPVRVKSVDHYSDFDKGLDSESYDLAFIHPSQVGLRAVKSGKYFGLATAKNYTDYRARVLVTKDSPLMPGSDFRNCKFGVPALESITTVMFTAHLKELGVDNPTANFTPTRYQDAVPFMIENGFVDAGVTASGAVIKAWQSKGGRVIGETSSVPIKQVIVSRKLSAEQRNLVKDVFLKLSDNDAGRVALKGLNINGFVPWDDAVMNEATKRLGI